MYDFSIIHFLNWWTPSYVSVRRVGSHAGATSSTLELIYSGYGDCIQNGVYIRRIYVYVFNNISIMWTRNSRLPSPLYWTWQSGQTKIQTVWLKRYPGVSSAAKVRTFCHGWSKARQTLTKWALTKLNLSGTP